MKNILITGLSLLLTTSVYAGMTCPSFDDVKSAELTQSFVNSYSGKYDFSSTPMRVNNYIWTVSVLGVPPKGLQESREIAKTRLKHVVSVSGPELTGSWCGQGDGRFFVCDYLTAEGDKVIATTSGK